MSDAEDFYHAKFEQLVVSLASEVIPDEADAALEPDPNRLGEVRVKFVSRLVPSRTAGLLLDNYWLEAVFFVDPPVSILRLDDFQLDDEYTTSQVRDLLHVIRAYLVGEGSVETRRTFFGRRRTQIRFQMDGREWLAREPLLGRRSHVPRGS